MPGNIFFPARFLLNCSCNCILKEYLSIDSAERYCNGLIMKCFTISSLFKETKIVNVGKVRVSKFLLVLLLGDGIAQR